MGGIVWLVILMICFGWISREGRLVGPFSWEFNGDNGDNFWSWMGAEHDNDVQMDQTLAAAKPVVTINDPAGDVTITASTDGKMHVRAHQMVHRNSDSEARKDLRASSSRRSKRPAAALSSAFRRKKAPVSI